MLDLIPGSTKTGIGDDNELTRCEFELEFEPERFYFDDGIHID